jgi:hypothetical protein
MCRDRWRRISFVVRQRFQSSFPAGERCHFAPRKRQTSTDVRSRSKGRWNKWDEASRKLSDHVQEQFPAGTPEAELKSRLEKQGFKPLASPRRDCVPAGQAMPAGQTYTPCPTSDPSKILVYRWGGVVCTETVAVRWTTDSVNAVTQVSARYDAACL